MKAVPIGLFAVLTMLGSCAGGPQQEAVSDSLARQGVPGLREPDADSPRSEMPVIPADTARQADMPVVRPPANVQPK